MENSRLYCGSIYLGIYLLTLFYKYCVFSMAHYMLFFAYYIIYILYSMHSREVGILECKESILNELFSTNQLIQFKNQTHERFMNQNGCIQICKIKSMWKELYVHSLNIMQKIPRWPTFSVKILKCTSNGHFTIPWGHGRGFVNSEAPHLTLHGRSHDNDNTKNVAHPDYIHTTWKIILQIKVLFKFKWLII